MFSMLEINSIEKALKFHENSGNLVSWQFAETPSCHKLSLSGLVLVPDLKK